MTTARTLQKKTISNTAHFKKCLLAWSQQFREAIYLDSNDYPQRYTSFDAAFAVDAFTSLRTDQHNAFEDLRQYQETTRDWLFGYLSYDLKNDTEDLKSENHDGLLFPDLFFFQPKKLIIVNGSTAEFHYIKVCDDEIDGDFTEINQIIITEAQTSKVVIQPRITHESYLDKVGQMLRHIQRGDIYEANFCMEFFAENAAIDPRSAFSKLNEISAPPFAIFLKVNKQFLLSASPERYLRKESNRIISQPIKGTARRSADSLEDKMIMKSLSANEKERSENIMIVDLVRNDLSRTATKGSVNVEELCQPYTFKQVHHLISTITSEIEGQTSTTEVIRTCFPMGSMTGAPKISAMEIIEKLEETKRGLYSGAVGYFTPESDFDFAVVIRSILYNAENKYLSFSVGSAITSLSDPQLEYDECMLKAAAMFRVLSD